MSLPSRISTVVKNISGARRFFGYLGARGAWVDNDSTYTEPGSLFMKFPRNRSKSSTIRDAIVRDLQNGVLQIVHTNSQIEPGQDALATGATPPNYFKAEGTGWVGKEFDPTT